MTHAVPGGLDRAPTRGERLMRAAREAAELRAYRTHPDVAALAIERTRTRVDALVWTGLILGLLFTQANVATFAARGATPWSVPWSIAWLLDPMVSLCLVGTLIGEATLARYQVRAGGWVHAAKWGLLSATYVMNTWSAWLARDPALVVLHSVPPATVFVAAEAITSLRERLTDAVAAAHRYATAAALRVRTAVTVEDHERATQEKPSEPRLDEPAAPAPVASVPADGGTAAPRAGSRTAELCRLLAAEVVPGERRSASELARLLAPRVGMTDGSARKVIARALAPYRPAAASSDAPTGDADGRRVVAMHRGGVHR